jgi:hypothetical protein
MPTPTNTNAGSSPAADLVKAIACVENIAANKVLRTNTFTSKYITLDVILDTVKPILAKHNLALKQSLISDDGRIGIATSIIHSSGEVFDFGRLLIKPETQTKNHNTGETMLVPFTAQQIGSALSYMRRISICVALSLAVDSDDDGAAASNQRSTPTASAAPAAKAPAAARPLTQPGR